MTEQDALTSNINTTDQGDTSIHTKRKSSAAREKVSQPSIDKPPRKRVRKMKLSGLNDLPLDILHEIFAKCHPYILLLLARTTKAFRAFLMSKSSKPIWGASLRTVVPALPPCHPSMSEPEYANLMFDRHCHTCLATRNLKVDFMLRLRYCQPCAQRCLTYSAEKDPELRDLQDTYGRFTGYKSKNTLASAWYKLAPKGVLQQLANTTLSEYRKREEHAMRCARWVEREKQFCKDERQARKAASANSRLAMDLKFFEAISHLKQTFPFK